MDKVRRVNLGSTVAIAILAIAMLEAGCTSQSDVDDTNVRREYCPRDMTMRCFERMGQPKSCTCVTREELEKLLDDLSGNEIY